MTHGLTSRYELFMGNGDVAECESITALLLAVRTLHEDSGSFPDYVLVNGRTAVWATTVARMHALEIGIIDSTRPV